MAKMAKQVLKTRKVSAQDDESQLCPRVTLDTFVQLNATGVFSGQPLIFIQNHCV